MIINYREAKEKELPEIENIIIKAYKPIAEVLPRLPGALENTFDKLKNSCYSKNLFVLFNECDKLIGTFSLKKINKDILKIYHLAIEPKFQDQGIGTWIIKKIIEDFGTKEKKIKEIELEIYAKIPRLLDFYKKLGFIQKEEKIIRNVKILILFKDLKRK